MTNPSLKSCLTMAISFFVIAYILFAIMDTAEAKKPYYEYEKCGFSREGTEYFISEIGRTKKMCRRMFQELIGLPLNPDSKESLDEQFKKNLLEVEVIGQLADLDIPCWQYCVFAAVLIFLFLLFCI